MNVHKNKTIPLTTAVLLTTAAGALAQIDNETLGTGAGAITTGDYNVLLGDGAGPSLSESSGNVLVGAHTGFLINNGGAADLADRNVFLGFRAAGAYTQAEWDAFIIDPVANPLPNLGGTVMTADENVFIGFHAGLRTRSGNDNVFIGAEAGLNNNSNDNVFVGTEAGENNTSGGDNTFIGEEAGFQNTTGSENTFIGEDAGAIISTGFGNTALGNEAMSGTGWSRNDPVAGASYNNTALGTDSGYDLGDMGTTWNNSFLGAFAGTDNGSGRANTFIGAHAGSNSENGDYNTFVGMAAGWDNNRARNETHGNRNTYMGIAAGATNREGNDNVSIGAMADFASWRGRSDDSYRDYFDSTSWTDFEVRSAGSTDGGGTPAIYRTVNIGSFGVASRNDTVNIGYAADSLAQRSITIGSDAQCTHANAIAIGYQASSHGENIAVIGNGTTTSLDPGADGVTALGSPFYRYSEANAETYKAIADTASSASMEFWADAGTADDDKWRMQAADGGDFTIETHAGGTYSEVLTVANDGLVTVAGDLNVNSDSRLKNDVKKIDGALDLLNEIEGKTYLWNPDLGRDERRRYGVIAQEVEAVIPELVSTNESDGIKSVNYQGFVPVLINAVNELKQENKQKSKEIDLLQQQVALLQQLVKANNVSP